MIHASELRDRAVIDLTDATKIGEVADLIVDADRQEIAALIVSSGRSLLGGGKDMVIPAEAIHSIGADAVTVQHTARDTTPESLTRLPRLSHLKDRRVVTDGGQLLGSVRDVMIEGSNCRIIGYTLAASEGSGGGIGGVFSGAPRREAEYIRADANLRIGPDLIVVPDDAVMSGAPTTRRAASGDVRRDDLRGSES